MNIKKPFLICEIGLNHLGSKKYLNKYLQFIKDKKIDAITIQILKDSFFKKKKFKKMKLNFDVINKFIDSVKISKKKIGIALNDISYLHHLERKKVDFYKVLSGDFKNINFIKSLLQNTNKKVYLSTGFSNFKEIKHVLSKINSKNVGLIHTSFDKKKKNINFERIKELKYKFKLPISYGNHSSNINSIPGSVMFLPENIFFYIKLNNSFKFPDNLHAVKLKEVTKLIKNINIKYKNLKNVNL